MVEEQQESKVTLLYRRPRRGALLIRKTRAAVFAACLQGQMKPQRFIESGQELCRDWSK